MSVTMGWVVLDGNGGGVPIGWFPGREDANDCAQRHAGAIVAECALHGELVAHALRFPSWGPPR